LVEPSAHMQQHGPLCQLLALSGHAAVSDLSALCDQKADIGGSREGAEMGQGCHSRGRHGLASANTCCRSVEQLSFCPQFLSRQGDDSVEKLVGVAGFEPATLRPERSASRPSLVNSLPVSVLIRWTIFVVCSRYLRDVCGT